jgi:hypothetical protein
MRSIINRVLKQVDYLAMMQDGFFLRFLITANAGF